MASENNTRLSASGRLRGAHNYYQWKSRVYSILEGKGLEEFIESTCTVPDPVRPFVAITTPIPTNQATSVVTGPDQAARALEIKAWKMNDGHAKTTIQANCATEPNDLIVAINAASEMRSVLKEHYGGQGQSLKAKYLMEIQQIQYSNYNNITSFIVAFNRLPIDSAYLIWAMRWSHTVRDATQTITLAALYQDITEEDRRHCNISKQTAVALYANNPRANHQNRKPNNGGSRNNANGNANSGSQDKPKCGYCNKIGHKEEDCFTKFPEKKEALNEKMKTQRNNRRNKRNGNVNANNNNNNKSAGNAGSSSNAFTHSLENLDM